MKKSKKIFQAIITLTAQGGSQIECRVQSFDPKSFSAYRALTMGGYDNFNNWEYNVRLLGDRLQEERKILFYSLIPNNLGTGRYCGVTVSISPVVEV